MIYVFVNHNNHPDFILYDIGNDSIKIQDSFVYDNDDVKRKFLEYLCMEFEGLELCRSVESMFNEWKAHNILYRLNIFKKSTRDTDLEYKQSKIVKFFYKLICRVFSE